VVVILAVDLFLDGVPEDLLAEKLLDLPMNDPAIRGNVTTAFVDSLLAGEQPETPARDALEVTRLIDAAYRSAASGQAIKLA